MIDLSEAIELYKELIEDFKVWEKENKNDVLWKEFIEIYRSCPEWWYRLDLPLVEYCYYFFVKAKQVEMKKND